MDAHDHRRALATLQKVYEDVARRAVESVLENEDGLRSSQFSPFAFQQIDDFGPRLINLGHLIGALQHLQRQRQPQTTWRVERVEGPLADLEQKINERIRQSPSDAVHGVSLAPGDAGVWHAFVTFSRTV